MDDKDTGSAGVHEADGAARVPGTMLNGEGTGRSGAAGGDLTALSCCVGVATISERDEAERPAWGAGNISATVAAGRVAGRAEKALVPGKSVI